MERMKSKCVVAPKHTAVAMVLWLLLPTSCIVWLHGILGPDPRLLYLAGVTLLPAGLTLLAPWLRAWLEVREDVSEMQKVQVQVQPLRPLW
jgi:hypothetical protein